MRLGFTPSTSKLKKEWQKYTFSYIEDKLLWEKKLGIIVFLYMHIRVSLDQIKLHNLSVFENAFILKPN